MTMMIIIIVIIITIIIGKERSRELINPNRLRIMGGTAKGKKIDSPDVYLRPMMAKVIIIIIVMLIIVVNDDGDV